MSLFQLIKTPYLECPNECPCLETLDMYVSHHNVYKYVMSSIECPMNVLVLTCMSSITISTSVSCLPPFHCGHVMCDV